MDLLSVGNNLRDSGLLDVNDHPCGPVEWMERAREGERERAEGKVTLWGSKIKETLRPPLGDWISSEDCDDFSIHFGF